MMLEQMSILHLSTIYTQGVQKACPLGSAKCREGVGWLPVDKAQVRQAKKGWGAKGMDLGQDGPSVGVPSTGRDNECPV
jgi:hypothetical protein